MPTASSRRRRSGNSAAPTTHQQSTLTFGSKSRISKPTSTPSTLKQAKNNVSSSSSSASTPSPPSLSPSPITVEVPSHIKPVTTTTAAAKHEEATAVEQPVAGSSKSENAVREQAQLHAQLPKTEEDRRAERLTQKDIQRYWQTEEENRIAPRIHQDGLSVEEKILRHFDISNQYGPCVGIARIKRWHRAHKLGLNPPLEVLAVLRREEDQGTSREKAYIDELMS
ncbi:hypothetical protein LOZ61_001838 [Ophidiomyces ophidiicola]|nr:hypothetical protein LOZ61_001838 [Ophidiomyces ophidiicola]KAI1929994.1 hypothetical protein LOZ60_001252 [Ophidiomyces ophidiicola]KAI2084629.1 hypothetical protein LOZ36_004639 [Ophidiomyces ophidiicola]KAI2149668.1 hypothetical protein LOZ27_000822 [Ophidiomyces ophidiicola]KAI2418763.1 hypothetical protein LOY90_000383 [Ophidiomyces ophidiicola]